MKLRSIIPFAAAAVMAISTAVIGAGAAAAATPSGLCVPGNYDACAVPEGSSPVRMCLWEGWIKMQGLCTGSAEFWLYNGLNHTGQIQEAGTSSCMQLDHDAGNLVIEARCNGASYQKWTAFLAPNGVDWMFYSMWDMNQCLTYNEDHQYLDTVACNGAWYQSFIPND
jgi:hypothetical protein